MMDEVINAERDWSFLLLLRVSNSVENTEIMLILRQLMN